MKSFQFIICILILPVISSCFAPFCKSETADLVWRDMHTRKIIFTSNDILAFDWDRQLVLLTDDAAFDFKNWIKNQYHYRNLVIEDENGQFYRGQYYHWASSIGAGGPTYMPVDRGFASRPTLAPVISIINGIPPVEDSTNDPRFNMRLKAGLEKAGVLSSIDLDSVHAEIKSAWIGNKPKKIGEDLYIFVQFIEGPVDFNSTPYANIYFSGGDKLRQQVDYLTLEIKYVSNNGTFRSDAKIENIPIDVIDNDRYVLRFEPWKPSEGSDKYPQPGLGLVSMTILFQKNSKTVYRLEIPERKIQIKGTPKDRLRYPHFGF